MNTKFWEMAVKTYSNGLKKKKMKKRSFSSSTALPNTDLVSNFVPKTRGYVSFIPALDVFYRFFLREKDRTSLMNIRTKGEVLKRLKSREISCYVKCILIGTGGIFADFSR